MGILSTFFSFVRSMRSEDAALQAKWTTIPSALVEPHGYQDEEQCYYQ